MSSRHVLFLSVFDSYFSMKLNYYKSTIFCRRKVQMGFNVFTPREKMKFFFGQTIEYLRYLILLTDDWNCVWTQVYLIQIWEQRNNFVIFCFLLWKQKRMVHSEWVIFLQTSFLNFRLRTSCLTIKSSCLKIWSTIFWRKWQTQTETANTSMRAGLYNEGK